MSNSRQYHKHGPKTDTNELRRILVLRKIRRRGDSLFESRRLGEIYIMGSLDCNLRCRACSLWGASGACNDPDFIRRYSKPLDLESWKRFFTQTLAFHPGMINFSGGEPLISNRWHPLAVFARKLNIPVSLTTNGVFLEKRMKEVFETLDQVNISLNGPPDVKADVRPGPKGHYSRMMKGLKVFSALRRRSGRRRPILNLMCTVFEGNYNRLADMMRFLKGEGVDVDHYYFQHLIYHDRRSLRAQEEELKAEGMDAGLTRGYAHVPAGIDIPAMEAEFELVRRLHKNVSFSMDLKGNDLRKYYSGKSPWLGRFYCLAPWQHITVLPNGDVWVCPDYKLGNIGRRPFSDIWNGRQAGHLRERVAQRLFPGCKGCFHYYSDKSGENPGLAGFGHGGE